MLVNNKYLIGPKFKILHLQSAVVVNTRKIIKFAPPPPDKNCMFNV